MTIVFCVILSHDCFMEYLALNIIISPSRFLSCCLELLDDRKSCNGLSGCLQNGARCSSVVRAFAHGAMGHQIDPLWGGPIELFLVPASAPRLV